MAISQRVYLGAVLLAAGAGVTGCARHAARPTADAAGAVSPAGAPLASGPQSPDLTQPPVVSADAGLEATWLVSGADAGAFASAVTPYLYEPLPVGPGSGDMWAANGLRMVRVPLKDWPEVSRALRIAGASQRQWLTASGTWTEIVRGPDRPRGQVVALDAERVELAPGRLRLLTRCWIAPVPPDASAERGEGSAAASGSRAEFVIELVPQLQDQRSVAGNAGMKAFTVEPKNRDAIEQGLVFSRMLMQMRVRSDVNGPYAYLVVSERPGADWRDAVGERPETDVAPESVGDRPAPGVGEVVRNGTSRPARGPVETPGAATAGPGGASGGTGAGPDAPLLSTLGEALFAAAMPSTKLNDEPEPVRRTARSLLVLIPRVPSEYRVLPAASRAPTLPAEPEKTRPAARVK